MNNLIKGTFNTCLARQGFSRKSSTWFKRTDQVIFSVNLQKSNYANSYYINLGLCLAKLSNIDVIEQTSPQLILRVEDLIEGEDVERLSQALDLENSLYDDDQRFVYLTDIVNRIVIPFFNSNDTEAKLINSIKNDPKLKARTVKELTEYIKIQEHINEL